MTDLFVRAQLFPIRAASVRQGTSVLFAIFLLACGIFNNEAQAQCNPTQIEKLTATGGQAFDVFGRAIAVSGDWAAITSARDDDNGTDSGSVTMFHHNGTQWIEDVKLLAPDGLAGDEFGSAVALLECRRYLVRRTKNLRCRRA